MMFGNRMLSTAPCFEDVFLFRCLKQEIRLRYAEFDPADPELDSVSQWFDLTGWPGVIAVAGEGERWQAARPNALVIGNEEEPPGSEPGPDYGFVRFAAHRADAGAIIAALRPRIVVAPPGLGELISGYVEARGDAASIYLVRAEEAATLGARLRLPLRRDEFRAADAQAGSLGRMLAAREVRIAALQAETEATRTRLVAEREAEAARLAAAHEADRARLIDEFDAVLGTERQRAAAEISTRDARIAELDQLAGAREADILSRLREIETLREALTAALDEAARLRSAAQEIARLTNTLDWPAAPRAVRAVLPLARLLRRASYLISR